MYQNLTTGAHLLRNLFGGGRGGKGKEAKGLSFL